MKKLLITGASGLIGKSMVSALWKEYEIIAVSRKSLDIDNAQFNMVQMDFTKEEDLSKLDKYDVDVVVHLGAVTGGCSERDGVLVNCEGTRLFTQYMIKQGCKKFVYASSIATIGTQDVNYVPEQIPIPDEAPCKDLFGYGLSKYLMEEVLRYLSRQHPDVDMMAIRLSSVPDQKGFDNFVERAKNDGFLPKGPWMINGLEVLCPADTVDLFKRAVDKALNPGLLILNGVPQYTNLPFTTASQLKYWWGDKVDTSYYEMEGNEYKTLYSNKKLVEHLEFIGSNRIKSN